MYLQLFFANLFFLTIFYYVGDNILTGRPARVLLHLFLVAMVAFYVSVLVLRILRDIYCVDESKARAMQRSCTSWWTACPSSSPSSSSSSSATATSRRSACSSTTPSIWSVWGQPSPKTTSTIPSSACGSSSALMSSAALPTSSTQWCSTLWATANSFRYSLPDAGQEYQRALQVPVPVLRLLPGSSRHAGGSQQDQDQRD